MNFSLTINTDDPNVITRIIAACGAGDPNANTTFTVANGGASLPSPTAPTPPAPNLPPMPLPPVSTDDDDNGPVDANAPVVDSKGLPWDERIHAGTKGTNKDGSWKQKRNTAPELVAQVEAELRARNGAAPAPMPSVPPALPPQMPVTPPPPPQVLTVPPPPAGVAPAMPPAMPPALPPQMPAPTMPPAAVDPVVAAAPVPAANPTTFHEFMTAVSERVSRPHPSGQGTMVDAEYLAQLAQAVSQGAQRPLSAITDLAQHEDLIPYTISVMQHQGRW